MNSREINLGGCTVFQGVCYYNIVRVSKNGMERRTRRHDIPNFIKQFQTQLLYTLFKDCKDSAEVINKGFEKALFLVTQAIDKIMTGEDIQQQDLVISELLRQAIKMDKSLCPHVSAAIQLSQGGRSLAKGDNIEYIYTNSQHSNPLCRVVPLA